MRWRICPVLLVSQPGGGSSASQTGKEFLMKDLFNQISNGLGGWEGLATS